MIQKMSQEVWKRYSSEYLHTLQQRSKWLKPNGPSPTIGSLVLIKDENLPPCKWTLARIITLHSGRDSVNRVATVKMACSNGPWSNWSTSRSFQRACLS
ncbi:hypothetical protein JTB14_011739 [Gonioctena quinquepunctata]|nr:hypothetical protein JTB14_011739 [Gonioctena quinquepunctata]